MLEITKQKTQNKDKKKRFKLTGIVAAMVSPMDENGDLNIDIVPQLVEFLLERGITGFFICGTNGEGFRLKTNERKVLAEEVMNVVDSRVPVVVHVGSLNYREVIELSEHASEIDADAISSVIPFYYSYTTDEIMEYYRNISSASLLPTVVYYLSDVNSSIDMKRFSEFISDSNRICGIKYTREDLYQIQLFNLSTKRDVQLYGGADSLPLPMLMAGVDALIGSNFTAIPELWVKVYNAFMDEDMKKAQFLQSRVVYYINKLRRFDSIRRAKGLLEVRGIKVGSAYMPNQKLSKDDYSFLEKVLNEMSVENLLSF